MKKTLILFSFFLVLFNPAISQDSYDLLKEHIISLGKHGYHHKSLHLADSLLTTSISDIQKISILEAKLYSLNVLENWHEFKSVIDKLIQLKEELGYSPSSLALENVELVWYYQSIRKLDSAIYVGKKGIKLAKHLEKPKQLFVLAKAYNNHGYTYCYLKDSIALQYFDSAQIILAKQPVLDTLTQARVYHNRGNFFINIGCKNQEAVNSLYNQSKYYYQTYNDPSKIALNYYVRSIFSLRKHELKEALNYGKLALNVLNSNSLNNADYQNYRLKVILLYSTYMSYKVLIKRGHSEYLEEAFNILLELAKTYKYVLNQDRSLDNLTFLSSYDINLTQSIMSVAYRLGELNSTHTYVPKAEDATYDMKYYLMNRMRSTNTTNSSSDIIWLVQEKLNRSTMIVDYYYLHGELYSLFITKNDFKLLKTTSLDKLQILVDSLSLENRPLIYQNQSNKLYEAIIGNVLDTLNEIKKIVIIPDKALNQLAFEALVTKPIEINDFRALNYLGFEKSIRYEYSLLNFINQETLSLNYNFKIFECQAKNKPALEFSNQLCQHLATNYQSAFWESLQLNKEHFVEEFNNQGFIHVSAHGNNTASEKEFITTLDFDNGLNQREEVENSGIYFNSGVLSINDISHIHLDSTNLLVLQGCETSAGKYFRGEGSYSVARAFYAQGAHTILGALWQIDDRYSSEVLEDFYENLETMKISSALQKAKYNFVKNAPSSATAHPNNWAGMVQYGEDTHIELRKKEDRYNYAVIALGFLILPLLIFNFRSKLLGLIKK